MNAPNLMKQMKNQLEMNVLVIKKFATQINDPVERNRILNQANKLHASILSEGFNTLTEAEVAYLWDISMVILAVYLDTMNDPEFYGVFFEN